MIEILKYILLGIIQGVCEVFPISSSFHLILFEKILNINSNNMLLEIILHLASLLAIILYKKERIKELILNFIICIKNKKTNDDFKLIIYLIIVLIPICVINLIFDIYINNLLLLAVFLLLNGIILSVVSNIHGNNKYNFKNINVIALSYVFTSLPGISRSGVVIASSKIAKVDDNKIVDFSLLLFIPTCILALIKILLFDKVTFDLNITLVIISFIFAFIFTYLSINLFPKIIKTNKLNIFSKYSIILSLIVIIYSILNNK